MTNQFDGPTSQPGDSTVPLVPDSGYAQPEVPPLEETVWPDFSYSDPAGPARYGAAEPTVDFGPSPTAPLPSVDQHPGLAYQQPSAPQPRPQAMYPPAPAPEPTRYEPYQPYVPPAPVPYAPQAVAPYAYPTAPEHPSAVSSLVLGLLGLFLVPVLAPVAWFVAGRGRSEIRRYPGRWASTGSLTAGYVLGIIGTLLWGLFATLLVFAVVVAMRF
jgi:hypothetical protein